MKDWKKLLVRPQTPILKAIEIIDASSSGAVLVVSDENHLLGTVTDGDIRRGILKGISLEEPVSCIMNCNPIFTRKDNNNAFNIMRRKQINQIPILDNENRVIGVEIISDFIASENKDNWVILMAGGLGTRLHPLTMDCPKPLLKVGNKPILETIIQGFVDYGFSKFFISVNYKSEMIEDYFLDGSKWGIEINYLKEQERLGTAGALSLLPERPSKPIIIMNGDLLTKVNYQQLLGFHLEHNASATMCVREYKYQIPYGVVQLDKHRLTTIVEKPFQQFFVSAGVYVLDPAVIDLIQPSEYLDMPTLFQNLVQKNISTAAFPIREYWLDIGRIGDYEKANGDFAEVFK